MVMCVEEMRGNLESEVQVTTGNKGRGLGSNVRRKDPAVMGTSAASSNCSKEEGDDQGGFQVRVIKRGCTTVQREIGGSSGGRKCSGRHDGTSATTSVGVSLLVMSIEQSRRSELRWLTFWRKR